jgi:DNA polymerase-4
MDAFYASVEVKDNPSLRGKPVLVGGLPGQRGVVAACSYEARRYGIHSAMPMSKAIRLCPQAVVLPVRMGRYIEICRQIRDIFLDCTPDIEPISIDEAFLDVTGCTALLGSAEQIAHKIKSEIKRQTGLTASVGIAPNKFLAKLASDLRKPDGLVVITEENKQAVLDPLPVSKIWGIGQVTAKRLLNAGIKTIAQIRTARPDTLSRLFGNQAEAILRLANGIDDRKVVTETDAKSISTEETFSADITDHDALFELLLHQVEQVSQRLRAELLQAQTVTLKFRYSDFRTVTRSRTLPSPTNTTRTLLSESETIFEEWFGKSAGALRLIGMGVSGLSCEGSGQRLLFSDPAEQKEKSLDSAFDRIRAKYGRDSLNRGKPG